MKIRYIYCSDCSKWINADTLKKEITPEKVDLLCPKCFNWLATG